MQNKPRYSENTSLRPPRFHSEQTNLPFKQAIPDTHHDVDLYTDALFSHLTVADLIDTYQNETVSEYLRHSNQQFAYDVMRESELKRAS
jgi:hypothetical protein